MPLRVAMVGLRAPWGTQGGVERVVSALAPRLVARDCQVTVYCRRRYNPLGTGRHEGVDLVDLDTLYSKHLEAIVHTARALRRAVRGHDLVHIHAMGPALLSFLPRLRGVPTVVTLHGRDDLRDKWGAPARLALRAGSWSAAWFAHRLICVSEELSREMSVRFGVDALHIPNGVDPISHVPLEAAAIEGLSPRGYLLYLGRLVPEKGLDTLIEAYAAAGPSMPLVVVGGSAYADAWVDGLKRDAPPGVVFTGPVYGEARDALLTNAAAFVSASRLEGFPIAPLEALAAGLPVLLSDIGPHREVLDGCGAGRLVAKDDWAPTLAQWGRMSKEQRAERAAGGKRHVAERFGWDAIADRTLAAYHEAMERS